MEEEAEKLKALQSEVEQQITADVTTRNFESSHSLILKNFFS